MGFHVALIFSSFLLASPVPAAVPSVTSKVAGILLNSADNTTFTSNGVRVTVPNITAPSVGTYSMTAYAGVDVDSSCRTTLEAGFNCSVTQHKAATCHFWYSLLGNQSNIDLPISPGDTVYMGVSTLFGSPLGGAVLLINESGEEEGRTQFTTNVTSASGFCGRSVGWFVRTNDVHHVPRFGTMTFRNATALGPEQGIFFGPQAKGARNTTINKDGLVVVEVLKPHNNSITFKHCC